MSIEKYHDVTDFGRAIQESSLRELRFVGKVMMDFLNLTLTLTVI